MNWINKDYKMDEFLWKELIPAIQQDRDNVGCDETSCPMTSIGNVTIATECPHDADNVHEKVKQIVLIPLTVLILVTNTTVLGCIIPHRRFHTPTYTFISSLAVADIFVGLVSIATVSTKANENSEDMCLVRIGFSIAAISASMWSLTFVAIDRYIAITHALLYRAIMTPSKTLAGITSSWFLSLLVGFLPLMGWRRQQYEYYCSFMYVLPKYYVLVLFSLTAVIPLISMSVIYGILFRSARFHIKRIEAIEKLQLEKRNSGVFGLSTRNIRSVKTLGSVFGCVFLTWLPFTISTIIQFFVIQTNCLLLEIIGTHLLVLGFSNSFLNPLIYVLGTKDFRSKVYHVFRRQCSSSTQQIAPAHF